MRSADEATADEKLQTMRDVNIERPPREIENPYAGTTRRRKKTKRARY